MSLVVARQEGLQLAVVSDTKLTYPDHETKTLKTRPEEGVIETVILSDNQCISFAGEIDVAEAALREIGFSQNNDQIIEILIRHHKLSQYRMEFLFCTGSPLMIYKFKNNEYGPVHSCWLGDKAAFEFFQSYMAGRPPKKGKWKHKKHVPKPQPPASKPIRWPRVESTNLNVSITPSIAKPSLSKMLKAMDFVIESGKVESVGGFKVQVLYNSKFT